MTLGNQTPFDKVLVANRGEIACRVIRSCKDLGLYTVAVYSEVDSDALHVAMADEAILIGPAPAVESYLNQDSILQACASSGAQAVHPGYGFLSENAQFAKRCEKNGLVFIGPSADAISLMGDKAQAKRKMIKSGVPCIRGYQGEDQSNSAFINASKTIGFPLMVKAAAGGGGRGMRLVSSSESLLPSIKDARTEAEIAFGAGDLILEKAIIGPRHVELQILADKHGNCVHLGERDCSVQRRHQKVLEEAPCPILSPALRAKMGAAAVKAATDINYVGAGTVEFLLDQNIDFYFLEMNTRLQVEHPVTELITDIDLVKQQIMVALGHPLTFKQDDIKFNGHAIEARLYAEDPSNDFLPSVGKIELWKAPELEGVRIDHGVQSGTSVSPFYDPMLGKIIAHGQSREEARQKLVKAIKQVVLFGIPTNRAFLIDALSQQSFVDGVASTGFINEHYPENNFPPKNIKQETYIAASILLFVAMRDLASADAQLQSNTLLNWNTGSANVPKFLFANGDQEIDVSITPQGKNNYTASIAETSYNVTFLSNDTNQAVIEISGYRQSVNFCAKVSLSGKQSIHLSIDGQDHFLINLNSTAALKDETIGAGKIIAPMHGLIIELPLVEGARVKKGERVAVLEAMKMQHELIADIDGIIKTIHADTGNQVSAEALLLEVTPDKPNK